MRHITKIIYFITCIRSMIQSDKYYVYKTVNGAFVASPVYKFNKKWGIPQLGIIKVSPFMDAYPDRYLSNKLEKLYLKLVSKSTILKTLD